MNIGLNLFSIRNLIQTEEDFLSTACKLKEMGYSYMQYSGAPFEADRIARVVERSGMPVYLTHVSMDRIIGDTEKLMEEHARFGCKNIGLGMMPLHILANEDNYKKKVEELNKAAEIMQRNGCKLFYHHHHYEFAKMANGDTYFAYMLKNAKLLNFTIDTYWLQYGGVDILSTLEKVKGRADCVHLKDYQIEKKKDGENINFIPRFAPIGLGNIDFKSVVEKMKEIGSEYYFVEQDDAAEYPDTLGEVEKSIKYIIKEL